MELARGLVAANAAALTDDELRCKRIFAYLESQCATDEARRSMHAWQQEYARRTKREALLPMGGTMEGSWRKVSGAIVGKLEGFFGGKGGRKTSTKTAGAKDNDDQNQPMRRTQRWEPPRIPEGRSLAEIPKSATVNSLDALSGKGEWKPVPKRGRMSLRSVF